jgi:4-coumarate--CoA ligase
MARPARRAAATDAVRGGGDRPARTRRAASSGTSGRPARDADYNAVAALAADQWPDPKAGESHRGAPFFHIYGLAAERGALPGGACWVTMPRFDLEQYLRLIEQHRGKRLHTVRRWCWR